MSDEGPDDMLPSTSTRGLDTSGHRLEFMIGDNVLPYEMTVYQAVQQFGSTPTMFDLTTEDSDSRNNSVMMYGSPGIWARIHTIYHRPVTTRSADGSNSSQSTSQSKIFLPLIFFPCMMYARIDKQNLRQLKFNHKININSYLTCIYHVLHGISLIYI